MISYTFTGMIGTAIPAFSTNITDLEIAWVNGQPRLYSANLPGLGAGYAVFDLSGGSGPASLLAVQGYSGVISHLRAPDILVQPTIAGGTANLIGTGMTPSGWASYGLTGAGTFGSLLNSPLAFNPVAVTSFSQGGSCYVFFAVQGSSTPITCRLADNGALSAVGTGGITTGGAELDDLTVATTGTGNYLLSVSATDNVISAHQIGADGSLSLAGQVSAQIGTGFSKPTEIASLTVGGSSFAIVAASESSSLSVYKILPGGALWNVDHVVDGLMNRFQGATALATLQIAGRGFVAVGGADGGVDIMELLPDGRLVSLMVITDTALMGLDHVSALALAQVGGRIMLFASSATEGGVTQIELDLGTLAAPQWKTAGVITGTGNNDLLAAGAGTTGIYGGAGDDLIIGGGTGGAALLFGGAGADRFILSASTATITIKDYEVGIDRLDLSSFPMLRNLDQMTITATATGAEIQVMGTRIVIESFDGNPISPTAFAQAHLIPLYRFAPDAQPSPSNGTSGDDVLVTGPSDGLLYGLGGNDSLIGNDGNDTLDAGVGQDTIIGGNGDDQIYGWSDNDRFYGDGGGDLVEGGDGDDWGLGGQGADRLDGGLGHDSMSGDEGDDQVFGGEGNDALAGYGGNDTLNGDDGNDLVWDDAGDDSVSGGAGQDTLYGGAGNDRLDGGSGHDLFYAGAGRDWLDGGLDNDYLLMGDGNDTAYGSLGRDSIGGEDGDDLIYGGGDDDVMSGVAGNDTIHGDLGNDLIWDGEGHDVAYGGDGNDTIYCGDGWNVALGGADGDLIYGGANPDYQYGDDGADTLYAFGGNDELRGGAGADILLAESGDDLLVGGDGNDILSGGSGNDLLQGGDGNDVLWDEAGNDVIYGGTGDDTMWGTDGLNYLYSEDGDDFVYGGVGTDVIVAGAGSDSVVASTGQDWIYGGDGADVFRFSSTADIGLWSGDAILDFTPGQDKIDLRGLGLTFGGAGWPSAVRDLRYVDYGSGLYFCADVTGDGQIDFTLYVTGVDHLTASDFLL